MQIFAGTVDREGHIISAGEGRWQCEHTARGRYRLTFQGASSDTPVVVITGWAPDIETAKATAADDVYAVVPAGPARVEVLVHDVQERAVEERGGYFAQDAGFSFVAICP